MIVIPPAAMAAVRDVSVKIVSVLKPVDAKPTVKTNRNQPQINRAG